MRLALVLVGVFAVACGGGGGDDGGSADAPASVDAAGGGADAPPSGGGVCPVTGYAACGGELLGEWTISGFCPDDPEAAAALFEHPFSDTPECADRTMNTVEGVLVHEGSLAFSGADVQINMTEEARVTWGFTTECLAAVFAKSTPEAACAELDSGNATCTFAAGFCTCDGVVPGKPSAETIAYAATDAMTLSIDGNSVSYCIDGDTLTLDWADHPVSWRYWVLERVID